MKTPTLIVRLIGLYLFLTNLFGLVQLRRAKPMIEEFGGFGESAHGALADFRIYVWLGMLVGLVATMCAGVIARLLTFDSGPEPE